jgi:succinyl-diaminopimelate desuccinylase
MIGSKQHTSTSVDAFRDIQGPVDLTRELLRHHTVTDDVASGFVESFSKWLSETGFEVMQVRAGANQHILATIGPESPKLRVAFIGHYDTVPAGQGWKYPPLGAVEEDGVLFGRGASDMKSGDAAMIFAAIALAREGVHSTVFLPGDEETVSQGMPALLELVRDPIDCCIGGEPTSKTRLGDCLKIGRRGRVAGTVTLRGQAGHAAYAQITPNVIHELPEVVRQLSAPWHDERCGTETTLSITNITTDSTALNVIPGSVTLTFDARFAPGRQVEDIEREIENRLSATGARYELNVSKRAPSYLTDVTSDPKSNQARFVQCAVREIEQSMGLTPAITCDGGASDARFVAAKGVPTIEFGVPHGNMHGPDEFVETRNIEILRDIYVRIVSAFGDRLRA